MRALFFTLDLIVFISIIFIVVSLRYFGTHDHLFLPTTQALLPPFAFCSFVLWVFSFYDFNSFKIQKVDYRNIVIAFVISLLVSGFAIYFATAIFNIVTPKTILVLVFIIYFTYVYISRKIYATFTLYHQKVLLLGNSNTLKIIEKALTKSSLYKVLGRFEEPKDILNFKGKSVDLIVLGSRMLQEKEDTWNVISTNFLNKGVHLILDYNFHEDIFNCSSMGSLKDDIWLLHGVASRQQKQIYHVIKRGMDIVFCLILLPILLPLGIFIYFAIKFIDGIPPLFFQKRIGKNEKTICIYKFRTMKPGTEEVTRLGSFLRTFRLDEIPQLINILKGDMSIVGPRPIWNEEYHFLNKHVPCHNIRSIIKPGLTGWAQLNFKAPPNYLRENFKNNAIIQDSTFDAAKKRLCYDVWYIKNRSLFLDLEIMFKTAKRAFIKDKKFN